MRTFALRDGDLQLAGDKFLMVEGPARLQQQIGLCLREDYGIDRFHPRWGSVLPSWIGRVIDPNIQDEVRREIYRVVKNFMRDQEYQVRQRSNLGLKPVLRPDEIIVDVSSVQIVQQQDSLLARVTLQTAGRTTITLVTSPGGSDAITQ